MLKNLHIKDYALIESLSVNFYEGLNIITGETGAGKSIIIDAMNLLLGERASVEVIRKGAVKSIIEGVFSLSNNKKIKKLLEENEIEFSDELIIRRELSLKGTNRCFVNDSVINLAALKELGGYLVDLHGQHEHQSLLRTETHIDYLDDFCNIESQLNHYYQRFKELSKAKDELRKLKEEINAINQQKFTITFQLNEINAIDPHPNEDEGIEQQLKLLESAEKRLELSGEIAELIYDSENSIYDKLHKVKILWGNLLDIDNSLDEVFKEIASAYTIIGEAAKTIKRYNTDIEIDPDSLDKMRRRLSEIVLLRKKYGMSLSALLELRDRLTNELQLSENFEAEIEKKESEIENLRKILGDIAEKISSERIKAAELLKKSVKKTLAELGIETSEFEVVIKQEESVDENFIISSGKKFKYNTKGFDSVEFFISTNIGEDLKPLIKVASGGEVSRIMLSLKTALALSEKLPLLIFDEIDTGISGRIGQKVGLALKKLSKSHQIIAITHLPQIAALADNHFHVEKVNYENRVSSSIRELSQNERVQEVAKLIGGEEITESNLKAAAELMK